MWMLVERVKWLNFHPYSPCDVFCDQSSTHYHMFIHLQLLKVQQSITTNVEPESIKEWDLI